MSTMATIATAIDWQLNAAGMLTSPDGRYLIMDTPKGKWTRLTISNGDVSAIDVYDTREDAMK